MNIGEKIRKIRKNKNFSMKQLGESVGVSEQAISQYERGKRKTNIEVLEKISKALGVSLSEILNEKKSLSMELIQLLEYPLIQKYGMNDILDVISYELKINYKDLEKVVYHSSELSPDDQLKLFELLQRLDIISFYHFCQENKDFVRANKTMNEIYEKAMINKVVEYKKNSFELFKNYLFVTFGDGSEDLGEENLRKIWTYINKILEFELHKLENKNEEGE